MYYVIQENTFNEKGHGRLIDGLERLKLQYEIIKVKPFVEELEFDTFRKDVFCFGGTKMSRLASNYGWKPGVVLTKNHDFMVYRNYYNENLLNYDSNVLQFSEDFPWTQGQYFIRPCKDDKSFAGQVFDFADWHKFQHTVLEQGSDYHSQLDSKTLIQVSPVKRIQREYRIWVVNGKIVTASQYKLGTRPFFSPQIEPDAITFAKEMVDLYQLAEAFVIDICLANDKWYVVECGCINSAGFYEADMQRLVIAIEEAF